MTQANPPAAGRLILVSGGARSGKSRFAQQLALDSGQERLFIATAQAWDQEMQTRIQKHRDDRGTEFACLEVPCDIDQALAKEKFYDVLLIDCLTLWISNFLMTENLSDEFIEARILHSLAFARTKAKQVILVSNEVGFSIVPDNALARRFRDLNGLLQQKIAAEASEVYLTVLGQALPLHRLRSPV